MVERQNGNGSNGAGQSHEIVLYVDDSPDSLRAYRLMRSSSLSFRTESASGHGLPVAKLGDTSYSTLAGVKKIVRGLDPDGFARYLRGDQY